MSAEAKDTIATWLRASPALRGALVRGVRFPDETFLTDVEARDFSTAALEQAWRLVADTFQVLSAQRLPPTRLTWTHEKTVMHCVQHPQGAILGIVLSRKVADVDPMALEKMLTEFQTLTFA